MRDRRVMGAGHAVAESIAVRSRKRRRDVKPVEVYYMTRRQKAEPETSSRKEDEIVPKEN